MKLQIYISVWPLASICQIAIGHELDNFNIQHTLVNPAPEIAPRLQMNLKMPTNEWNPISVGVHKITPEMVANAPKV